MKSHFLYRLHSFLKRVVHVALGLLSWLKKAIVRTVAAIRNTMCMVLLLALLTGCHVNRHVVTHVDDTRVTQTGHREQCLSSSLDSMFSYLSASADSITIVLYDNAFASATPCGSTVPIAHGEAGASLFAVGPDSLQGSAPAKPPAKTSSPKARITVHSPRVNKEQRSGSATHVQTNMADSTRSNTESHTSTDDSKESIGGAEPPNLTWVFIVLGLGITLLLLGAIFGYLWLHKKGIV